MSKRSYSQNCSLAHALDLIGERWSLLLIRELLTGPKRYKDMMEGLAGIGSNLLAARLKELEGVGIVEKKTLAPPAGSVVYQLTQMGKGLEAAILELVRWGLSLEGKGDPHYLSKPEWDIVALRALFRPEKAKRIQETYQFEIEGVVYHARIKDGSAKVELGALRKTDVTLITDRATLAALGKGLSLKDAVASGKLQLEGSNKAAKRMRKIFAMSQEN